MRYLSDYVVQVMFGAKTALQSRNLALRVRNSLASTHLVDLTTGSPGGTDMKLLKRLGSRVFAEQLKTFGTLQN